MFLTITYVSDCLIEAADRAAAIEQMFDDARDRNAARGVTGALLFAGNRFAQTIEGGYLVVDALMTRIDRDPRHRVRAIVERRAISERRFPGCSVAYLGDSVFVSRALARALSGGPIPPPADAHRLLQMLREFTVPMPARRPRPSAT